MTETNPTGSRMFTVQNQAAGASKQPLQIYHLSHDLRGPLNSILGFTELLLEGVEGPLNEIQTEDIAAMRQSAQNLLQLISAVVDLSKLAANRLNLSFGPVDFGQVVQEALSVDTSSPVEVSATLPDSLPPIEGDQGRVEQMVLALLNFARKLKQEGKLQVSLEQTQTDATLQINAPDVLMPPEQESELFELVVHTDDAGRSELGVGGLNLPLAHQLAQAHQGNMWVESKAAGTTFFLRLPLHEPA